MTPTTDLPKYVVVRENILGYVLPNNTLGILAGSVIRGAVVSWKDGTTALPVTADGQPDLSVIRPATLADFESFMVSPRGHLT